MPQELDPAWEYFEPDREIAEVLAMSGVYGVDFESVFDGKLYENKNLGIRFGKGNPDRPKLILAKAKPEREDRSLSPVECKTCKETFKPKTKETKYCSRKCFHISDALRDRRTIADAECLTCKEAFRPVKGRRRYCSKGCYYLSQEFTQKKRLPKPCRQCGNSFVPARNSVKFCGRECYFASPEFKTTRTPEDRSVKCLGCGTIFLSNKGDRKYCTNECYHRSKCKKVKKSCPNCQVLYTPYFSTQKFCSKSCHDLKQRKTEKTYGIGECRNCGARLMKETGPNKLEILYCSRRCKNAANNRVSRRRKSGSN